MVVHRGAAHVPEDAVALLGHEALLLARERVEDPEGVEPFNGLGGLIDSYMCMNMCVFFWGGVINL